MFVSASLKDCDDTCFRMTVDSMSRIKEIPLMKSPHDKLVDLVPEVIRRRDLPPTEKDALPSSSQAILVWDSQEAIKNAASE